MDSFSLLIVCLVSGIGSYSANGKHLQGTRGRGKRGQGIYLTPLPGPQFCQWLHYSMVRPLWVSLSSCQPLGHCFLSLLLVKENITLTAVTMVRKTSFKTHNSGIARRERDRAQLETYWGFMAKSRVRGQGMEDH